MHLMGYMSKLPHVLITLSAVGGTGVHVFFYISGIGLYLSYLNKRVQLKDFIKKRFNKIYVPYIVVVTISFFLPWMYDGNDRARAFLSHIFLFKVFIPQYEASFGMQFWFISTIIQLYLLFIPMCVLKDRLKNNKIFLSIFMMVSVSWWIICYLLNVSEVRVWNSFCFQYIWEFALGFIIAEKFHQGNSFKFNRILLAFVAVLGIGLQAILATSSESLRLFNDIPAVLGYSALAMLFMEIDSVEAIFQYISGFSYELFLVHILVIETIFQFIKPQGLVNQVYVGTLALFLAMFVAYFYHKVILDWMYKQRMENIK